MATDIADAESRLWAVADKLWANTGLKPSEFSTPVLGLIFLRYSETRFVEVQRKYLAKGTSVEDNEKYDYQAEGVMFLPDKARFSALLKLAEADNLGKALITRHGEQQGAARGYNPDKRGRIRLVLSHETLSLGRLRPPRYALPVNGRGEEV